MRKGADKQFHEQYAEIGLLNKITYPTGGSSKFVYEPHFLGITSDISSSPKTYSVGFVDNWDADMGQVAMNRKVVGPDFVENRC